LAGRLLEMLTAMGRSSVDGIDVDYAEGWTFHPAFRVFTTRLHGGVLDEGVLGERAVRRSVPKSPRGGLVLVRSGEVLLRLRGPGHPRLLRAGDAALVAPGDYLARMDPAGTEAVAVTAIDWVVGLGGGACRSGADIGHLAPSTLAAADELSLAAADDETNRTTAATCALLDSLRSEGIPLERMTASDIGIELPDVLQRLARCFARTASRPGASAGMTDLVQATGRSPRQVARLIADFSERFEMANTGYRDAMMRSRVHLGSMFMSARNATTEAVAKFLGYSDATAYCRAHAGLGVPSPAELARALRTAT
jgi:hypothetical protein